MPSTTLTVATCNALNLALPNRRFYANQDPYSATEYARKVEWLGGRLSALAADAVMVQEVWDQSALAAVAKASHIRGATVIAPGAEQSGTLTGTPVVGLITRLEVLSVATPKALPPAFRVDISGLGRIETFSRPPLVARVRMKHGQELTLVGIHLKSKRPKFLIDDQGKHLEDRDDPAVATLASMRSLMIRGAEAAGVRALLLETLQRSSEPVILMGDFNDGPHSVTTQLMAATHEVAYNRHARDVALFNAWEAQGEAALKRDVAYSHIHQGWPELLDHIFVSEELLPQSRFSIGDVRRVDAFNDHLHEGRSRHTSDHGLVRAVIRVQTPE
jgi:endonuclease/exonuclease/phosphatase family metal-dependent hydrolase